jgi:hypothetical protein
MIQMNLLQEDVAPSVTRMPAAEFSGRIGEPLLFIHEIKISENLSLVIDEQQAIDLAEALANALPQSQDDDQGEEWKGEQPA